MTISYNDVLDNMKNDYYQKCGKILDLNSETGARIQAVASEIYSLNCYGDFVLKQAFPQTATSRYLDKHAQLRGVQRKKATKAYGTLTFYCSDECVDVVKIPKGTVCSVKNNPYIQFITLSDAQFNASNVKFIEVEAQAISEGYESNVEPNTISVIVNPPVGIARVSNSKRFIGGLDNETDSMLRKRILSSYNICPNGFNNKSAINALQTIEEVRDCSIKVIDIYNIEICVETTRGIITPELEEKIRNALYLEKLVGCYIKVVPASYKEYSLAIEVYKNKDTNDNLDSDIKNAVLEIANSTGIAQNVKLSEFISAISNIKGVKYCEVSSENAIQNVVYSGNREILKNNSLKVAYYD